MRIYTSYFYQIRFFPTNLIPLSTAVWDPKWYHEGQSQSHVFKDRRGVLNGCRIPELVPREVEGAECRGICNPRTPETCGFLKNYRNQLDQYDFTGFISKLSQISVNYAMLVGATQTDIALIFHEAPNNKCSEREVVKAWFSDNYYPITEWHK